jgi:hypothetical protein
MMDGPTLKNPGCGDEAVHPRIQVAHNTGRIARVEAGLCAISTLSFARAGQTTVAINPIVYTEKIVRSFLGRRGQT